MNKIALYCFKTQTVITHDIVEFASQEKDLQYSIKKIDSKKFLIQENSKKKIIFLNELFYIDENMFILFDASIHPHAISSEPNSNFKCAHLTHHLIDFIKSLVESIPSIRFEFQNRTLPLIKILTYMAMIILILSESTSVSEEMEKARDYSLQGNIYLGYQDLNQRAIPFPITDQKNTLTPKLILTKKEPFISHSVKKRSPPTARDADTLFFFTLKERYAKK